MPILVDTNVIVDVLYSDPLWAEWARSQMGRYVGEMWINPLIYAELCHQADSAEEVDGILARLDLEYRELPKECLFLAAKAYRSYRQKGGMKTSLLSDFFIGAHAEVVGCAILTRDRGRYGTYFPKVKLICP